MFSQLGPLFKSHLRQAEKSDARLEIRRDERQEHGQKQEQEQSEDSGNSLWEDSTAVSVEALKAFLIEFLRNRGDEVPEAPPLAEAASVQTAPELTPVNTRTARAVAAYSSTAAHAAQPPVLPETPQNSANTEPPADLVSLLAADEIRTMHVLITELEGLSRQGVQTLVIEKAETFLSALVLAVRAKQLEMAGA